MYVVDAYFCLSEGVLGVQVNLYKRRKGITAGVSKIGDKKNN